MGEYAAQHALVGDRVQRGAEIVGEAAGHQPVSRVHRRIAADSHEPDERTDLAVDCRLRSHPQPVVAVGVLVGIVEYRVVPDRGADSVIAEPSSPVCSLRIMRRTPRFR